jgi:hypothetical protein
MKNFWPAIALLLVVAVLVYKGIANKSHSLKEVPPVATVGSKGSETSPAQLNEKPRAEHAPPANASSVLGPASGETHPPPPGGGEEKINAAKKLQVLREQSIFKR